MGSIIERQSLIFEGDITRKIPLSLLFDVFFLFHQLRIFSDSFFLRENKLKMKDFFHVRLPLSDVLKKDKKCEKSFPSSYWNSKLRLTSYC